MSMCSPSPSGSFIHTWSQSESSGHNIDMQGGVGQANCPEVERGEASYPRLPRSCLELSKKATKQ